VGRHVDIALAFLSRFVQTSGRHDSRKVRGTEQRPSRVISHNILITIIARITCSQKKKKVQAKSNHHEEASFFSPICGPDAHNSASIMQVCSAAENLR
jgi:hypothetical protein